jgi:hypothetical protein
MRLRVRCLQGKPETGLGLALTAEALALFLAFRGNVLEVTLGHGGDDDA